MRILIIGAGDIGIHLAKILATENHEIVVIDIDLNKLDYLNNHYDIITIRGSATSYQTLIDANVNSADLFIATTEFEETNLLACIYAKKIGAKKTIARVGNTELNNLSKVITFKDLGIDEIISPETLAAREIKRVLRRSGITDMFDFDNGKLLLAGTIINGKSTLESYALNEIKTKLELVNCNFIAVVRDGQTIIPHGDLQLMENDHVYFITKSEALNEILDLSGQGGQTLKSVLILGGGKIGIETARILQDKFKVWLIEKDEEKCFEIAERLAKTTILHGDGRNVQFLEENGISSMDVFVAVTGNSETNMITSLFAKEKRIKKTISLVENMDYINLSLDLGVDTMINKKLIAANFILRYIRKGEIVSLASLHGVDAEILEYVVKEDSKIRNSQIQNLKLPKSAVVGGVIRSEKAIIPDGNFKFMTNDRAVILSKPESISQVEEFFK